MKALVVFGQSGGELSGLKLVHIVRLSALRTPGSVHIRIVCVNISATFAAEDVVC